MKLFIGGSLKHIKNFCQDEGMFTEHFETREYVADINCEFQRTRGTELESWGRQDEMPDRDESPDDERYQEVDDKNIQVQCEQCWCTTQNQLDPHISLRALTPGCWEFLREGRAWVPLRTLILAGAVSQTMPPSLGATHIQKQIKVGYKRPAWASRLPMGSVKLPLNHTQFKPAFFTSL